jgi:DNA invertase Pin-like site-specific DNA recombinase
MIAAIYARKSKKKEDVAEDSQMVPLQIANARAFAHSKGWTVNERFIFEDDGKSGAEFERRPGFQQMMNALIPKAPFRPDCLRTEISRTRDVRDRLHHQATR